MPAPRPDPATDAPPTGRVWLRPIEAADYGPLRRFELTVTLGPRWRHRGATPSPESFVSSLWGGVLAQFLVQAGHRPDPIGIVTSYGHDLQSGTAWVAAARFDPHDQPAPFVAGARQFLDYLFATWPFRKLYAEVLAPNLDAMGRGATDLFRTEGVLRDHAWVDGAYVDQHLLALTRADWEARPALGQARSGGHEGIPSLDAFLAQVAQDLDRDLADLDPDHPVADLGLDSLDWLVLADHLDHLVGDADAALEAFGEAMTLRALHRWVTTERCARAIPDATNPDR